MLKIAVILKLGVNMILISYTNYKWQYRGDLVPVIHQINISADSIENARAKEGVRAFAFA